MKFGARLGFLAVLLLAEKVALSGLVDASRARDALGLGAWVHVAQHWGFRYLVTFIAAMSIFAFVRAQQAPGLREVVARLPDVRLPWILLHALLVAALAPLSYFLYRGDATQLGFAAMAGVWLVLYGSAVIAAGVALLPSSLWLRVSRSVGIGWLYAALVALLGTSAWLGSEKLWLAATKITFQLVQLVLLPILPDLTVDPVTRVISAPHFAVEVTEACSGLEGLGLTLAFSVLWLVYFRREYILPRALILIPLSLAAIFGLNALRIAALLLIGNAGHPEVAAYGFHSQAGWIAFNAVACALVFFSRRSPWLNRTAVFADGFTKIHNPTATYLLPLLAILAAGMVSHALSGIFETLYPLRLIAAVVTILALRRPLLAIPWRWTWRGPAVGAGVSLLWIGAARWLLPVLNMPGPLTGMSPLQRNLWIASHCLSSVTCVPIAEELAYRGYLMRRLTSPAFEAIPYRSVRWPALTLTAITFGAAHGTLWLPGIAAGVAYGLLVTRYDSLGEAVVAHATTNGVLAFAVVAGNQWQLW